MAVMIVHILHLGLHSDIHSDAYRLFYDVLHKLCANAVL